MRRCIKVFWKQVYKLSLDTQVLITAVSEDVADGQNIKGFPFSIVEIVDNTVIDDY